MPVIHHMTGKINSLKGTLRSLLHKYIRRQECLLKFYLEGDFICNHHGQGKRPQWDSIFVWWMVRKGLLKELLMGLKWCYLFLNRYKSKIPCLKNVPIRGVDCGGCPKEQIVIHHQLYATQDSFHWVLGCHTFCCARFLVSTLDAHLLSKNQHHLLSFLIYKQALH